MSEGQSRRTQRIAEFVAEYVRDNYGSEWTAGGTLEFGALMHDRDDETFGDVVREWLRIDAKQQATIERIATREAQS